MSVLCGRAFDCHRATEAPLDEPGSRARQRAIPLYVLKRPLEFWLEAGQLDMIKCPRSMRQHPQALRCDYVVPIGHQNP